MGSVEQPQNALMERAKSRFWALGLMLTVVACSGDGCGGGGGGCDSGCGGGGCASTPYPDQAPAVRNGAQVRVASHGFDFIEENASPLVGQLIDGGLTFCLPASTGPDLCYARTCPSTGETGCELSVELADVQIDAIDPNKIRATILISGLDQETDFVELNLGFALACRIGLGTVDNQGLPASLEATFLVDPITEDVTVDLDPDSIEIDFGRLDIDIDGQEFIDIALCEGIDFITELPGIRDLIFGAVTDPLVGAIGGFTEPLLCQQCETDQDCSNGSQCVTSENDGDLTICYNTDTERCVPAPLGLEDVLDTGALLSGITPGLEAELAYQVKAFGYADVLAGGLSLGMRGGTYGDKAECVPAVPPPTQLEAPVSQVLRGNEDPDGEPFHVGIGIHEYFVNEALWGIYQSGTLCLTVGTDTVDLISTSTFATLVPSLRDLTGRENKPLFLQLSPQEPPTAQIGAGTIDPETGDLIDPLLTLNWNQLDIHFYAFIHERFVRVFTVSADLVIPIGLDVTEEGIIPVIGDLAAAFARVEVKNSELLTEEPEFLEGLLPSLVNIAVPLLGDTLNNPIEIPEFSGFALDLGPGSLRGIENNTMLGVFARLAIAEPDMMEAPAPRLETQVHLVDLRLPSDDLLRPREDMTETERVDRLVASRPVATFEARALLWGEPTPPGEAQYSYRLDGGFWTPWRHSPRIEIDDHILLLQGRHHLEVRSRFAGMIKTVDLSPAQVSFDVDFDRPELEVELRGNTLEFVGSDTVSSEGELTYAWRLSDAEWSNFGPGTRVELPTTAWDGRVEVRVRDLTGRETLVRRTFPVHGKVEQAENSGGCECATPATPVRSGSWWGLAFLTVGALVFVRRRRLRKGLAVLGLFTLVLGAGCSDDAKGGAAQMTLPGCTDNDDCDDGQACIDGTCEGRGECSEDSDCPDGQVCQEQGGVSECVDDTCSEDSDCSELDCGPTRGVCSEGACECEEPCAEGCGEGEFCCESQNNCQALPDPCADTACEPGFTTEEVSRGTGNADTCEVTGAECTCVELLPLSEGQIGRYLDLVEVDGTVVASAYNDTYGDLMIGVLGEGDTWTWTFVDGVPSDGPVTGKIDGPRGGVATPGDDVGRFSSLDAAADGTLHVAYRDDTNGALKYARGTSAGGGSWEWSVMTIDTVGNPGHWNSVTLSPEGVPAIAHMATAVPGEDPSQPVATGALRWTEATSAAPATAEDWVGQDLDGKSFEHWCNGGCESNEKCRTDTNACERSVGAARCNDECGSEQACFEGGCADVLQSGAPQSLPPGVGLFARAARYPDGRAAIVYYDRSGSDLRFIEQTGNTWAAPAILAGRDGEGVDTGDAGQFCDLAIDADGVAHISYVDAIRDDLRYIQLGQDVNQIVDDGVRVTPEGVSIGLVGDDSAIALTPTGPRIAYMDSTRHDLILARRAENGNWDLLTLAGHSEPYVGSFGFYNRHLWTDDGSLVVGFRYNRQMDPPVAGLAVHRF